MRLDWLTGLYGVATFVVGGIMGTVYPLCPPDPPPVAAPACEPCAECVAVSGRPDSSGQAPTTEGVGDHSGTATFDAGYAAGLEVGRNALRQLMADWPREETQ